MNVVARVAQPYRELLSIPAAARFTGAAFMWQMPLAMLPLALVIFIEGQRDSYSFAGLLTAVVVITSALSAPWLSWLIDRYGQQRVLTPGLGLHVVAVSLLLASISTQVPRAAMVGCALCAGLSWPPMEAIVRARWTYLLRHAEHPDALHRAFSWESVLDEVIAVLGPVLVTTLAYSISPLTACVVTVAGALLGGVLLLIQHESHPPPTARAHRPAEGSALRIPGMGTVALTAVGLGATIGALQVTVVAFTHNRGIPLAAGWLLAGWGISSMISGLVYGAVSWRWSVGLRFLLSMACLAVGTGVLVITESVVVLGLLLLATGASSSPALIAGFSLVQRLVPSRQLTEGIAWLSAAMTVGYGLATGLVGMIIDNHGARWAFGVPLASALLGLGIASVGYRRYRHAG